jgi:transcriptional regulator with XRE-family HTH domain
MVALASAFGKCHCQAPLAFVPASVPVVMQMARAGKTDADVARSPVVRRRELGALLRDLRVEAGLTVEQVADRLLVSPSKISRLETGQRGASLRDIRDLCDLYQVDGAQRDHLAALAIEGRGQAWWQPYGLPYATYVGLEAEAVHISDFEPGVFPGLLQIPDFARAVHETAMPKLTPALIEQRIDERRRRQEIITRQDPPPPQLQAIVDEAVLRRAIGGPAVMRAQIDHVIEACQLPNITVQVLPFDTGAHPALDSTFILLEFAGPVPAVVYVEGLVGHLYLERAQDVERYERVFERLRTIALSEQQSLDLMARISTTFRNH